MLLDEGALDVFTTSIQMKKDRPGTLLTCICNEENTDRFAELLLQHTKTIGVRKTLCDRYILQKNIEELKTANGIIRIKKSSGFGISRIKPEYDDIARIAKELQMTFFEIEESATEAFQTNKSFDDIILERKKNT